MLGDCHILYVIANDDTAQAVIVVIVALQVSSEPSLFNALCISFDSLSSQVRKPAPAPALNATAHEVT